jgi:peptide/nickel transport system substrate-binding protein
MNNKKINIIIGAAAALVAAAVGLGIFYLWKPQPKGIVIAVSNLPDSLNPVLGQNVSGLNADELVFDGLVNFEVDPDSGELYPELALAEAIEQDPGTKQDYSVLLRQVYWHDGTELTAEDVEFSFAAYTDETNDSPKREYLLSYIQSVTAVDRRTVNIRFNKPLPPFRAYPVLTFKIIPASYHGRRMATDLRAGENERSFAVEPVGTGPFRLAGWEIGKWVSFEANGAYFKKRPEATSLVMKRVIDPIIRMNELRKSRVNLILETFPLDRPQVEEMSRVDIESFMPYAFYQVSINTQVFPSTEARQAMSMALDRSSLVPPITNREQGVVLNHGPFPSDIFARNIPEYVSAPPPNLLPYDENAARALAASGGLSGQKAILLYPDSLGEFGAAMAQSIVEQLAGIGLTVEAKRTGDQVFKRMVFTEKSYELALLYCDGFDNLYSDLNQWFHSGGKNNVSQIADAGLDRLLEQWGKAVTTEEWVDLTLQINRRISELAPAIFLCTLQKDVYSRGLNGVVIATDNPFLSVEHWSLRG